MTSTASRPIIDAGLVLLDVDAGADKQAVIARLVGSLADAGRTSDADGLISAAMAREEQSATGLPGGIAIPHCRSPYVETASIGFARLQPPVDFGAPDGPADLAFLIAAPEAGGAEHMKLLSSLARALVRKEFVQSLRDASSADEVVGLVDEVLNPAEKPKAAAPVEKPAAAKAKTLIAITACPTGIAHTYMAADSLVAAAKEAGVTLHVETQGSSGSTPLSADTIAGADAVIFATDVGVKDKGRFAGKPVIASGVKRAINEPAKMVAEAVAAADNPNAARVEGSGADAAASSAPAGGVGWGTRTRQILLTGVSYMIPFVAAGGLLIALGFFFGGWEIANKPDGGTQSFGNMYALENSLWNLPPGGFSQYLGAVLFSLGGLAFSFLVPALAGYIAFAIADRPGIAPGFTAGAVAVFVGAGFIGGIVGGLIAGFAALWISKWAVPKWFRGLMPVVIIPLCASLDRRPPDVHAARPPLGRGDDRLDQLAHRHVRDLRRSARRHPRPDDVLRPRRPGQQGGIRVRRRRAHRGHHVVLRDHGHGDGRRHGAASCDGPRDLRATAAVQRARAGERQGRCASGLCFISEGAIPFAAADPFRVIPSMMFGGALTGAICMAAGVTSRAPHGGIFVFFAIGGILWFIIAILVGTVAGAVAVIAAKQFAKPSVKVDETPALANA